MMHETRDSVRVLLIDDNRDVVDSLACALELNGVRVERAYDGASGLRTAAAIAPDVIILDLLLPDLDGYLLAEAVRNDPHCRDAFLIAYTGDGSDAARQRCASVGIDSYVLKPAEPEQLYRLVLEGAQATQGEPSRRRHFVVVR